MRAFEVRLQLPVNNYMDQFVFHIQSFSVLQFGLYIQPEEWTNIMKISTVLWSCLLLMIETLIQQNVMTCIDEVICEITLTVSQEKRYYDKM